MSEYISWSPIRRLMKHNGAVIVARDAVDELVDWMGQSAEKITKSALTLTKHAKRKKVTTDDILLAIKYLFIGCSARVMKGISIFGILISLFVEEYNSLSYFG